MSDKLSRTAENLMKQVGVRKARILRGREEGPPSFWRAVAMFGAIGWAVALPTLLGVALGTWIDHRWPSHYSWTLMLLLGGLAMGCADAWMRINREQEKRR
jgi:ATP synthase protein I